MAAWIGISEVCEILGLSPNTVKKLVREGNLKAYQITGVQGFRFKREDVEGLIKPVEASAPNKSGIKPKGKSNR